MCGIVGLIGEEKASEQLFPALMAVQHRGQDAAGILSYSLESQEFYLEKDLGLVEQVFTEEKLKRLKGNMAIGHTRYSTIGTVQKQDLQPLTLSYPYGLGMIHNGNVTNYKEVLELIKSKHQRFTFTHNDLELLLHTMAIGILQNPEGEMKTRLTKAAKFILDHVKGAFSVIGILAGEGMFAFSDPHGIRPLLIGRKNVDGKYHYCLASEKQVFYALGYEFWRDVKAGEFVFINTEQEFFSQMLTEEVAKPCMFEWIYFASAENEWHGRPVYETRLRLGKFLAKEVLKNKNIKIDVVAPVPDTSRAAACSLAEELKLPYREVLIKNRYVQRSFIVNQSAKRESLLKLKLLPVESEIKGKNVLLVDDSIVRGSTSKRIIQILKEAGANKVYLASTCPAIQFPCYYGIDFPSGDQLIAHNKSEQDVKELLGVDELFYLPLESLKEALNIPSFCSACLDGKYPVKVEQDGFLQTRAQNILANATLESGVRV